jgi:hypothetical protein
MDVVMLDLVGERSEAESVGHDDIAFGASANLPGQRQADCGRKGHSIALECFLTRHALASKDNGKSDVNR